MKSTNRAHRGIYIYRQKDSAKIVARKIAKQCKALEKLYDPKHLYDRETQTVRDELDFPKGIGWVKVAGPGLINVEEGTWAVKIECWKGSAFGGVTVGARILIFKNRTYAVEAQPGFPDKFLRYFENQS